MNPRSPTVFVCEDDEDDRFFFEEAFSRLPGSRVIQYASDGAHLLELLDAYDVAQGMPLILLDLNMPRMDGRETLRALRKHDVLPLVPVVVISTSNAREDVDDAYALGANTYFAKPLAFQDLVGLLEVILAYWGAWALVPRLNASPPRSGP